MPRFAHLSDIHLGAFRDPKLRELNYKAFESALQKCLEKNVDFVVISGDLFDSNLPDLKIVVKAAKIMHELRGHGIRFYVTYGSHDYSASTTSIIDVLESTGLFTKVVSGGSVMVNGEERIRLGFFKDEPTGAQITGIYGRRNGLESEYFKVLDKDYLEKQGGFKIFVFHSIITEFKSEVAGETVPLSLLPRNFNYYAGGHMHNHIHEYVEQYGWIAYPGPLFGSGFDDIEKTAMGEERGFYIVDFDKDIKDISFERISVCDIIYQEFDANNKTSREITEQLTNFVNTADCREKIVLIKVKGELSSGNPSDIHFSELREVLINRGAIAAEINRRNLTSREIQQVRVQGSTKSEIEEKLFKEYISQYKIDPAITEQRVKEVLSNTLVGDEGVRTARILLNSLNIEQKENETKNDFMERVIKSAFEVFDYGDL